MRIGLIVWDRFPESSKFIGPEPQKRIFSRQTRTVTTILSRTARVNQQGHGFSVPDKRKSFV